MSRAKAPQMDPREALKTAREAISNLQDIVSVRRVYGEPVEREGATVIPAATVIGGGGGGDGTSPPGEGGGEEPRAGSGLGFGLIAWPAGAFELRADGARWIPAFDLTRIALGMALLAFLAFRCALRR